jgi:DNA-binding CsgD family transcriptional regulator
MYDTEMSATQEKIDQLANQAYTQALANNSNQLATLLTHKEKIVLGRRILIAQAIVAGKTRSEVMALMQISPNTFSQIKQWLQSELAEYTSAYNTTNTSHTNQPVQTFSYEYMKQRYPGHFLLFSLTEELFKLAKK